MSELPLAVRIAAGLAATAVERARRLPQDLAELPVTAVSQAMQVSMRLQQQITDLAIKGDNAIAQLRTPAEEPPWAVFDEDLDEDELAGRTSAGRAERADTVDTAEATDEYDRVARVDLAEEWYETEYADELGDGAAPEIVVEPLEPADDDTDTTASAASNGRTSSTSAAAAAAETADTPARTRGHAGKSGPDVLPVYPELSLASVRARLRTFDAAGLQALLDYELAHQNRPEFVRMLTNRIGTVRGR